MGVRQTPQAGKMRHGGHPAPHSASAFMARRGQGGDRRAAVADLPATAPTSTIAWSVGIGGQPSPTGARAAPDACAPSAPSPSPSLPPSHRPRPACAPNCYPPPPSPFPLPRPAHLFGIDGRHPAPQPGEKPRRPAGCKQPRQGQPCRRPPGTAPQAPARMLQGPKSACAFLNAMRQEGQRGGRRAERMREGAAGARRGPGYGQFPLHPTHGRSKNTAAPGADLATVRPPPPPPTSLNRRPPPHAAAAATRALPAHGAAMEISC